jgi:hypothetical protein
VYQNGVPALNDGKTPHVLTVRDVPVDGFWSITVYNAKGFMEPNCGFHASRPLIPAHAGPTFRAGLSNRLSCRA